MKGSREVSRPHVKVKFSGNVMPCRSAFKVCETSEGSEQKCGALLFRGLAVLAKLRQKDTVWLWLLGC